MNKINAFAQCSSPITIVPAYGKRYKTAEDMVTAWCRGADFQIIGASYCSIRDWETLLYTASSVTLSQRQGNLSVIL